jgi:tRNA pseudouridine55 synthase
MKELLLIDKPKGITSFDVIRQLRRKTGIRKFGHAGTLDPLASGLMLLGVEKGTKLLANLVGLDKTYTATILIGEKRSTGDLEGVVMEEKEYADDIEKNEVENVLKSLCGEVELPVSAYSAIKKDGVPMYKMARAAEKAGEKIEDIPLRKMKVYSADLISSSVVLDNNKKRLELTVDFSVSSGTYIRSLAEEIGRRLNYPAVMSDLRRTSIGEYKIAEAILLDDFTLKNLEDN